MAEKGVTVGGRGDELRLPVEPETAGSEVPVVPALEGVGETDIVRLELAPGSE